MTNLTDEALDALVAELQRSTTPGAVLTTQAREAFAVAATAITALRAREAAIVAAAYEAAGQWMDARILALDSAKKAQEARSIYSDPPLTSGGHDANKILVEMLRREITALSSDAAVIRALTPSDATAALEAIKRAERNKTRREIAEWHRNEGWKLDEDDVPGAILATIEPEDGK